MDSPTTHDQPRQSLATATTPALTPGLKALLEGGESDHAIAAIIERRDLREEAIAALPHLERAARQEAGPAGVRSVIGRRFTLYPAQDFSDGEWAAWWADYIEVCADLPMAALEAGMLDWVRDPASKFMPKPGELRERSLKVQNKAALACYRARKVAEHRDPVEREARLFEAPNLRPLPTPQAKEAVKAMFEDFSARVPREGPTRAIPPVNGPVDQGALTDEMRAVMARRYQSQDAS